MKRIKIGIAGLGNCASSLLQGIQYYNNKNEKDVIGLMNWDICGYKPHNIDIVAAFDIDKRKVGKDLSEAIFQLPNCTKIFCDDIPETGVKVNKGPVLDGIASHMRDYFQVDENQKPVDVTKVLKESGAEILISYLPVGSQHATEYYAQCAIDAGCGFINCIPQFIVSRQDWIDKFESANIPIIGDDIKSQIGATELHRIITQMIIDRGGRVDNTWQLNYGGNCDFLNMLDRNRLKSKKISKTEAVQSVLGDMRLNEENIHIGPSDFIPHLKDNKLCDIRIDFRIFGDIACSIDCKLSVIDSPNSAGCVIDCIRLAKIALDRRIGGPIIPACSYYMKHPPEQMREEIAKRQLEDFINGKRTD